MKRTIVIAAVIGLAANAFAFQSSEVSQVLRDQLSGMTDANYSQMGTADFANATAGGVSDLGSATGQDAVSAKDAAVRGAKAAGRAAKSAASATKDAAIEGAIFSKNKAVSASEATGNAATAVGNFVFDETLAPTYQDLLVPTGRGIKSAALWVVEDLSPAISAGVSNVYYGLEFSASAVVGDMGITGTGKAISADGSDLSKVAISQSNTAGTADGISNANSVAQSKNSSSASAEFSSNPVEQISQYKKERVRKAAQAARRTINAYGADSKQATAALLKVGQVAAIEAGVKVNADQAYATGVLFTSAINM